MDNQSPELFGPTPSQTVGPFFHISLDWRGGADLTGAAESKPLTLVGQVRDGAGDAVPDALLELWHTSAGETVIGRCATGEDGAFVFRTALTGLAAPVWLGVFARRLLARLVTRVCFDGATAPDDPVLAAVPEARRRSLLARREGEAWRFDIRLRGPDETVFFHWR